MQSLSYITSKQSAEIDNILMGELNFSSQQLMEIAGLSVADVIYENILNENIKSITVVSGPGSKNNYLLTIDNGGDGLVIARTLKMYNQLLNITVIYPKVSKDEINLKHLSTCEVNEITIIKNLASKQEIEETIKYHIDSSDLIVDAIFGYSFKSEKGVIREPFSYFIDAFKQNSKRIISVDVPSGWVIDEEKINSELFYPEYLVSLGVPKICTKLYNGNHYLGGRFIPQSLLTKLDIQLPKYFGNKQYTKF